MAVKEGQHLTGSIGGTDQACPDQTLSLYGADETHTVQITDVVSELGLQVAWNSNGKKRRTIGFLNKKSYVQDTRRTSGAG